MERTEIPSKTVFGNQSFPVSERDQIAKALQQKLRADEVETRPGPHGKEITYLESWKSIELANETFGFNGWSSSIVDITTDFCEGAEGKWKCGVTAVIRVTLRDGTFHEDVGWGSAEDRRKGPALENAKKEAVSDARKRALRIFGNRLGNCLYDKAHLSQVKSEMIKNARQSTSTGKLETTSQTSQSSPMNPLLSQTPPTQQPLVKPQTVPQPQIQFPPKMSQPPAKQILPQKTSFVQTTTSSFLSPMQPSQKISPTGSPSSLVPPDYFDDFGDLDGFDNSEGLDDFRPVGQKSPNAPPNADHKDLTPPDKKQKPQQKNFIEVH